MLELKNITKSYTTAGFTQKALDGVSIAFRDNEFAAVLGPSGSGKTTMLNIVGGLDLYDSGDLDVDSVSTRRYKARDWDAYRNNRIGFVFQSYNLIPHQTVLSNVELALTLSGVSKAERRARAIRALEEVDLGEHIRKKPSQLSGGQMQRVAIARALINDPEILLADEPTGALDTQTGRQVMELLSRIAKDRLVIMVTHNNALASQYANRIVTLTDGQVVSDSRPFDPAVEDWRAGRKIRRSSMSFMTAIMLSFSNLMTKKARTFITSFAGSIGIIGIGAIFALSNGINAYIKNMEEETLSVYPLTILSTGMDLSAFFGESDGAREDERRDDRSDVVRERRIVERLFSSQSKNDLTSLKAYFDENASTLDEYVNTIQYTYDITPQIYLADTSKGAEQVNPDSVIGSYRMGASGGFGAQGGMFSMNMFSEMPGELRMYENQYHMLAGRWPKNYDEAVLVLSPGGRISDFELYSLGLRDRAELKAIAESFMSKSENSVEISKGAGLYTYDTLMSASFRVVNPADLYVYDHTYEVWVDKSNDSAYVKSLVDNGLVLSIVGIVQPDSDANAAPLAHGINYTSDLIRYLMAEAAGKSIVREQLANTAVNVLTGSTFAEEQENPESLFDFSKIISVDENVFREAFAFDFEFPSSGLGGLDFDNLDLSGMDLSGMDLGDMDFGSLDFSGISLQMPDVTMPELDLSLLIQAIAAEINIPAEDLQLIMYEVMNDFFVNVVIKEGLTDPNEIMAAFAAYIMDPEVQASLAVKLSQVIDIDALGAQVSAAIQDFMMSAMQTYMTQMMGAIQLQIQQGMQSAAAQIQKSMQDVLAKLSKEMQSAMQGVTAQIKQGIESAFAGLSAQMQSAMEDVDPDALAGAFQIKMGEEEVLELMTVIMNPVESTYERNLMLLGYADPDAPSQISIYPRNFESKQAALHILDSYNSSMEDAGETEKMIRYTDIVGIMMSTVTDIVDMVSYALVAFVSVSLVVSSIMIGVITFISVLERRKEIGILRAIGASKQNIRLVFNAEALIIGFTAGIMGVLVTAIVSFTANIIIYNELGIARLVLIPAWLPSALVAVSMFLTFIAGLFPSSAAARRAPVEALRSE